MLNGKGLRGFPWPVSPTSAKQRTERVHISRFPSPSPGLSISKMKNWVLHFPSFPELGERTLTKGTNRIVLGPFLGLEEAALGVMG